MIDTMSEQMSVIKFGCVKVVVRMCEAVCCVKRRVERSTKFSARVM